MKLAIITDDGEVYTATDDIDQYNMDKSIARSSVCDDIKDALQAAFDEFGRN